MLAAAAAAWTAAHDRDTYREDLCTLIDVLLAGAGRATNRSPETQR
jgi:hypothetical protein